MRYDPIKHHRRSIRLRGHDYSDPGEYYVTICTHNRECVLGEIKDGEMRLSNAGEIAERCWYEIPQHFENVGLGEFVTMPNHLHVIILLRGISRRDEVTSSLQIMSSSLRVTSSLQIMSSSLQVTSSLQIMSSSLRVTSSLRNDTRIETEQTIIKRPPTLGQVVAFYKYRSTKLINALRDSPGSRFWQRNYYEHIIRDGSEYARIQKYIADNANKWSEDEENPRALS